MYYLIILLSVIAACRACGPPPCHWTNPAPFENYFHEVANAMIAADRKAETFCRTYSGNMLQVAYEENYYQLAFPGNGLDLSDIDVSFDGRVLLVQGTGSCSSMNEMRIVPPNVDIARMTTLMDNGDLLVRMPYKGNIWRGVTKYCPHT